MKPASEIQCNGATRLPGYGTIVLTFFLDTLSTTVSIFGVLGAVHPIGILRRRHDVLKPEYTIDQETQTLLEILLAT